MALRTVILAFIFTLALGASGMRLPEESRHVSMAGQQNVTDSVRQDSVVSRTLNFPSVLLAPDKEPHEKRSGATGNVSKGKGNRFSPSFLSVKTNILPWMATIMNLEGEIGFSGKISLAIPVWYCPWFIGDQKSLRILFLQPEARWWFSSPGKGHFLGIHASVAWFNMKYNKYRYQDRGRPLLGAGITYGYSLRFKKNWGLEFSAGAGYVNTRYDRFYNVFNGRLHDTCVTSYFGLDHLSVSLVYYFPIH